MSLLVDIARAARGEETSLDWPLFQSFSEATAAGFGEGGPHAGEMFRVGPNALNCQVYGPTRIPSAAIVRAASIAPSITPASAPMAAPPTRAGQIAQADPAKTEEDFKGEFHASPTLQAEFPSIEHYVALRKAEVAGRIKVYGGGAGLFRERAPAK
jgi:hypothetical protein